MTNALHCPLCTATTITAFHQDKFRHYFRCQHCFLVFVPSHQHLDVRAEKALYDLHQNHLEDSGYRQFLTRLASPLLYKLPSPAHGLDYGCGPAPLLAGMLSEAGHQVNTYDPIYAPDTHCLSQQYDFISCSEVVEHFRQPDLEFSRLFGLLKPHGYLGLMTKLVLDADAFSRWHYKNDLSHICFFSKPCFEWLATRYQCDVEFIGADVVLFKRMLEH